jgi:hypothetical protein
MKLRGRNLSSAKKDRKKEMSAESEVKMGR